ncbi:MAG: hypothetical protein QM778_13895 [Myxococcales bacterium]
MAFRAPLLGYNTNVRHKGKLYHIQTEDSGVGHPHIITHLFADGGRIVASKKTSYTEHVGSQAMQDTVKKLMQAQHKAMFIALRDGVYDEGGPNDAARDQTGTHSLVNMPPVPADPATLVSPASAKAAEGDRQSLYQGTRAAAKISETPTPPKAPPSSRAPRSIFGGDLLSEKSLDEVILSYLATDEPEPKR